MPNTNTQRTILGGANSRNVVRLINISSDGSEESNLIVFDNSDFWNSVTKGSVMSIRASGSSCTVSLVWDQTTDSPICSFDPSQTQELCFKHHGGVPNPGGTGATGDILMTTAGLDSGDVITLVIEIRE